MIIAFDPKLDSIPSIVEVKSLIVKLKKVAIGQMAPDFVQNDVDGNPVRFSDVYSQNELTLLDFWAAWCGPCRAENPNVVAVFNEFNNKGFTVFGVSLDREKHQWVKAIEDDKLNGHRFQICLTGKMKRLRLYSVKSFLQACWLIKTV